MRRRKIRALVEKLLAAHKVAAPPVPVERIARSHAARIYLQSLDADISGFAYRDDKRTVIGVNTHHVPVRQRFTIAHELGHLLLNDQRQMHVDHDFSLQLRSNVSRQGVDEGEMEANFFAAELLMPIEFLQRDLETIKAVNLLDDKVTDNLAKRYGVSTQALLIRLAVLGYVKH